MTLLLPRVDEGLTWINYWIYSVLDFLLENWRKDASRFYVSSFFSSLLSQLIGIPWYVFPLHLSFEAPRRRLDLPVLGSSRPRVRSDLFYPTVRFGLVLKNRKPYGAVFKNRKCSGAVRSFHVSYGAVLFGFHIY